MRPAPGGPEPMASVASPRDDASPSRARLGRVAEMLREAEEATPQGRRRARRGRDAGTVLAPARPRVRSAVPAPRRAADDVLTASAAGPRT